MTHLDDFMGTRHLPVADSRACRIVSLVPSLTELLCDLGLTDQIVGRTGFCIHPRQAVASIPKVGGTKDVNIEKIRRLSPTHLIVNIDENEKPTVDALAEFVPNIVVTHPLSQLDNPNVFKLFGGIFCREQEAETLCQQFDTELADLRHATRNHAHASSDASHPNRVLYCIWQDPWMTVSRDTYIARMLELIGWQQWASPLSQRYPTFEWTQSLINDIDEVILSSEPYRFMEQHVDALERQIGKPVRLVDGEMLSWYGSRAIKGLGYLTGLASPQ
ncbi:MAG: helical backbone metal receptor [Betaproteobacteria bacterium]